VGETDPVGPFLHYLMAECGVSPNTLAAYRSDIIKFTRWRSEHAPGPISELDIPVLSRFTGHLVLSTLHANDAMGTITRLVNMEIEPFLVTEAVSLVGAQRLVRGICRSCAVPYQPEESLLRRFKLGDGETAFAKGAGCSECRGIGYRGRLALLELAEMTPDLKESILEGQHAQTLREAAVARGMVTLLQDGIAKAKQGLTTLEEVLRVCVEN
jgi:type II secretory ATPase GspE/PulE/Tfp pilus assembly ATPase PilB-like protein